MENKSLYLISALLFVILVFVNINLASGSFICNDNVCVNKGIYKVTTSASSITLTPSGITVAEGGGDGDRDEENTDESGSGSGSSGGGGGGGGGGIASTALEYCGNGFCNTISENAENCPQDCKKSEEAAKETEKKAGEQKSSETASEETAKKKGLARITGAVIKNITNALGVKVTIAIGVFIAGIITGVIILKIYKKKKMLGYY